MHNTTTDQLAARFVGPAAGPVLNIMGTDNEVKLHADHCGGSASIFEITARPGDGIPPHTHTREQEMFYVLEGEVEFNDEGQTTIATAGTMVFLPPHRQHAWVVRGDKPARMLLILVPGTFNKFFDELASPPGELRPILEVLEISARHGITFAPPPHAEA